MDTPTTIRDRHGIEVLDLAACRRLLTSRRLGRVAYLDAGAPRIVPVNYRVDGAGIVFRSRVGAKLDAAERGRPLAFEIDGHDPLARAGWSVLVTGPAEVVDAPEVVARLEAEDDLDTWAFADATDAAWVRIRPESITGRRVRTPFRPHLTAYAADAAAQVATAVRRATRPTGSPDPR